MPRLTNTRRQVPIISTPATPWYWCSLPENHSQHRRYQIYSEYIVAICEEPNASHSHGSYMIPICVSRFWPPGKRIFHIPSEWDFVYFRKREPPSQIRICDVGVIVVKIMESRIATVGSYSRGWQRGLRQVFHLVVQLLRV